MEEWARNLLFARFYREKTFDLMSITEELIWLE